MTVDLNVRAETMEHVEAFAALAKRLGFEIIVTSYGREAKIIPTKDVQIKILRRRELRGKTINALKTQTNQFRRKAAILAVPLGGGSVTNWAAKDPRIDLLTLASLDRKMSLSRTTARIAAASDTALEIPIEPLLRHRGLDRSRYLKAYREAVEVALAADMQVVLVSGAVDVFDLRSPDALSYIGAVIGLDRKYVQNALRWARNRVLRNLERMRPEFITPGVEIVGRVSE